jgi:hypothetical protein
MAVCRRSLFQAAIALPILATSGQARAEVELVDYPMAADPAVVAALRAAAAAYRMQSEVFVHVLPTAPALLVPQMTHQIQNDIVMARSDIIADLDAAGYFVEAAPRPRFADRLLVAGRKGGGELAGPIAFTDPSPGRPRDEVAILAALGLGGFRHIGAIDGLDAAAMVARGEAGAALIRASELAATPGLVALREVPVEIAAADIFIATVTRTPIRPRPEGFVAFLASPAGSAILARHGLERLT